MSDVIDRVDLRLSEVGKTWADLGRAVGASDQRLYNWRNRGIPKTAMLGVARFLGWTVDKLLTGNESALTGQGQRAGEGSTSSVSEPHTINGLLQAMHPDLVTAHKDMREAIEALVLTYQTNPKEGERVAKAIKTLLKKDT